MSDQPTNDFDKLEAEKNTFAGLAKSFNGTPAPDDFIPFRKREFDKSKIVWMRRAMPQPKAIDRLLSDRIARDFVTLVAGSGGSGKSGWLVSTALALANGGGYLGDEVDLTSPGSGTGFKVLYVNLEDGQDMVNRSFMAAMDEHEGVKADDRLAALGRDTFAKAIGDDRLRLLITNEKTKEVEIDKGTMDALRKFLSDFDVVIFDPAKNLYGGTAMGNEAMNVLYDALADLAVSLHIAVVVCAHTRKPSGAQRQAQDQHDVKHGSEAVDTARCVLNLNRLDKKAKEEIGFDPDKVIVAVSTSKTNIGRERITFTEIVTVDVDCEAGRTETVAVHKAIKPPAAAERDIAAWAVVKPRLEQEFVFGKIRANTNEWCVSFGDVLKDVQERGGVSVGKPTEVRDRWLRKGWIEIVEDDNPNPGSKADAAQIERIVVGPTGP